MMIIIISICLALFLTFKGGTTPTDSTSVCRQSPLIMDHCLSTFNRWYFDRDRDRCRRVKAEQCLMGLNQFGAKTDCRRSCKSRRRYSSSSPMAVRQTFSWKDVCTTEMNVADCSTNVSVRQVWFFNASAGVCQQCRFGGKYDFKNTFAEQFDCRWACVNITAQWKVQSCSECDSPTSYCTYDQSSSLSSCYCRRGFDRRSGFRNCEDVDECSDSLVKRCHQNGECINTIGSYYCRCKENYIGDGKTFCNQTNLLPTSIAPLTRCQVSTKHECQIRNHNCAPEAVCLHSDQNYFCQCPDGFSGDGTYCNPNASSAVQVDVSQCYKQGLMCDRYAACYNFAAKYFCQCVYGYKGNGTKCSLLPSPDPIMIDTLYCKRNDKYCSTDAYCYHQSPSTYLCRCKPGYDGDGIRCAESVSNNVISPQETGKNLCVRNGLKCSERASCKSVDGSHYCQCHVGFAGNGIHCTNETGACFDVFDERYRSQCGSYSFLKWYYFDYQHRICRMFWFGKCVDNIRSRNVFSSKETCYQLCQSPKLHWGTSQKHWSKIPPATWELTTRRTTAPVAPAKPGTTTPVIHKRLPVECQLPCQPGSCSSTMVMYFYNGASGQCAPFLYTGCGGNSNRFHSLAFCEAACVSPYVKDVEEACLLPLSNGFGRNDKKCQISSGVSYYYNPYFGDCQEFFYYGCGGNANRFQTKEECSIRCMRKVPTSVAILDKRNLLDCFSPKDEGHCQFIPNAPRIRYYYNSDNRTCVPFNFNGCGGNENRFGERSVCEYICGDLFKPKSKMCIGWPDAGHCNDINIKWYFNLKTGQCQEFSWTGCGGNTNRFATRQQCTDTCVVADDNL